MKTATETSGYAKRRSSGSRRDTCLLDNKDAALIAHKEVLNTELSIRHRNTLQIEKIAKMQE